MTAVRCGGIYMPRRVVSHARTLIINVSRGRPSYRLPRQARGRTLAPARGPTGGCAVRKNSGRAHHRVEHSPTPHIGQTMPPSSARPKPAVALDALTPLDGTRPYHRQYGLPRARRRACRRIENVRCRIARRRSNSHGSEPVAKVHPARFVLYRAVWTPAFAGMTWLTCGGISLLRR